MLLISFDVQRNNASTSFFSKMETAYLMVRSYLDIIALKTRLEIIRKNFILLKIRMQKVFKLAL